MTNITVKSEMNIKFWADGSATLMTSENCEGHDISSDQVLEDMIQNIQTADWASLDDMEAFGKRVLACVQTERQRVQRRNAFVTDGFLEMVNRFREMPLEHKSRPALIENILSHSDNSPVAVLVKARLIEMETGGGLVNSGSAEHTSLLARSLEDFLDTDTPAAEERVQDVLWGISTEGEDHE